MIFISAKTKRNWNYVFSYEWSN